MSQLARKPYDPALHNRYEPKDRELVKDFFFRVHHWTLIDHSLDESSKYDIDLMRSDGKRFVELEHRPPWNTPTFSFETIHIPGRKKRSLTERQDEAIYCIVNDQFDRIAICAVKDILLFPVKWQWNILTRQQEQFFDVKKTYFEAYHSDPASGEWKRVGF